MCWHPSGFWSSAAWRSVYGLLVLIGRRCRAGPESNTPAGSRAAFDCLLQRAFRLIRVARATRTFARSNCNTAALGFCPICCCTRCCAPAVLLFHQIQIHRLFQRRKIIRRQLEGLVKFRARPGIILLLEQRGSQEHRKLRIFRIGLFPDHDKFWTALSRLPWAR